MSKSEAASVPRELTAFESGFAFAAAGSPAASGTRLWFSADGRDWSSTLVPATLFRLVSDGVELVGFNGESATRVSLPDG